MRPISHFLGPLRRHSSTAIVAASVAALTAGGPAIAGSIVDFARNADKVDGRHAVGARSSPAERAHKLVATNGAGRLPNDIIAHAPDSDRLGGQDLAGVVATAQSGLQERVTGTCSAAQTLTAIQADGSVTCSERYARTVIVSPGDTPAHSGQALYDAMWTIWQDNTAQDRYLIVLEPGVYDVGSGIELPPYIDLQGAGQRATVIKGGGWNNAGVFYFGATIRASNFGDDERSIRDLTIESTGTPGEYAAALALTNTDFELSNVALTVSGGAHVAGLWADGTGIHRLEDVQIKAYSSENGAFVDGIGIANPTSFVTGGNVWASGGVQATVNGIRLQSTGGAQRYVELRDVDVQVQGGGNQAALRTESANSVVAYNSRLGSGGYAVLADPDTTNWMVYSVLGGERSGPLNCAESLESWTFSPLAADCS